MTLLKLQQVRMASAVVVLCLLMIGYLAYNLWKLDLFEITLIRLFALVVVVVLLVAKVPTKGSGVPILIIGIVALMGAPTSGISLGVLFICLTVLALRKLPVEFIAKSSAYILGIAVAMSLLMVYFGIVVSEEDVVSSSLELGGEIRSRMTFGYRNVNAFAGLVSSFCLLLMMTGKLKFGRYVIALLLSYALYIETNSRAMLMASLSFVAFTCIFLIGKYLPLFLKIFAGIILITPVLLTVSAYYVAAEVPLLDLVLSGRLNFTSSYFSEIADYRFLIGGAEPSAATTVDNSFALLIGSLGMPLFIYLIYITYKRLCKSVNEADFRTYSFLQAFWLYSFTESSMVRPESIVCIVFWFLVLCPKPEIPARKYPI